MQYINQRLLNELEQRVKQQEHTIQQLLRIVANLNKNVVQLSSEQKEKKYKSSNLRTTLRKASTQDRLIQN